MVNATIDNLYPTERMLLEQLSGLLYEWIDGKFDRVKIHRFPEYKALKLTRNNYPGIDFFLKDSTVIVAYTAYEPGRTNAYLDAVSFSVSDPELFEKIRVRVLSVQPREQ